MKLMHLFSLFNKREKCQLVIVLFALLLMGFIELIGVGSIGPFISVVSNPQIIHTNAYLNTLYAWFNFSSDTSFIIAIGFAVIFVLVISNLCLAAVNFIMSYFSTKRRHTIAMRLFEKYLRQPYIFYLNTNTSELSKRILDDVRNLVSGVLISLLQLISSAFIALSIVLLLVIIKPLLALVISLAIALSYCIIFLFIRSFLTRKGKERDEYQSLEYKYITESFNGIKDIKILGKEKIFLDLFEKPSRKLAMNDALRDIISDIPKYLLETVAIGGIVGIIIFMIYFGASIDDFLPVLTVYAFGAYRLLPLLQKMFRAVTNIKYHFPMVENLYKDFEELPTGNDIRGGPVSRMDFHTHIRIENMVFRYPTGNKDIIKDQSLTIGVNTSIALVGSTGCGKTTLVDIILGLLEAQEGKLFIDDVEITDSNRRNWQKNLGYVPQTIYLTDDTIRNNIAFGIESKKIDEEAVIKAAQTANIHEFIMSDLESGYDTVIGERGIRLSGGQRQRIGIARAVYHDPAVLILDEATSALDSMTENAIIDAIKKLSHRKTIIMIAHRISTVKSCDMIYMMDQGQVVDQGSYEELYQKNDVFRKMADGV